jgi:signal transduction histidine kinase
MRVLIERLSARPLRWQFIALLLATQMMAQIATMVAIGPLSRSIGVGREAIVVDSLAPFITTVNIAHAMASDTKRAIIDAAIASDARFSITQFLAFTDVGSSGYEKRVGDGVKAMLSEPAAVRVAILTRTNVTSFFEPPFLLDAAYRMDDGRWLVFDQGSGGALRTVPFLIVALTIMLTAAPLSILAIWAGLALVSPMTALARGAERFSLNLDGPAIAAEGPMEVRALAHTLNTMRDRIKKLVDDRSHMLAAISHDMRTPLTRLALRIEDVEDADTREQMAGEVRRINAMIESGLTFLRAQKQQLTLAKVDIAVLARTIADELGDQGHPVVFGGKAHVVGYCDRELMRRAIENLAGNAIDHGGGAELSVRYDGEAVVITVSDHGPGIAEADQQAVLEPFAKADSARGEASALHRFSHSGFGQGGFGLGLSIIKAIAELHGGRLVLEPNAPQGLKASIILDLAAEGSAHVTAPRENPFLLSAKPKPVTTP